MVRFLFRRRRRPRRRRRSDRWRRQLRWLATGFAIGASVTVSAQSGALPLSHPIAAAVFDLWSAVSGGRHAPRAHAPKHSAAPRAGGRAVGLAYAIDGDTVELNTGRRRLRVRVRALHAPELSDPGGRAAHQAMRRLAALGPFTCTTSGQTSHTRAVADCRTVFGEDVATALIRAGVAAHCERYGRPELARLSQPRRIWNDRPAYCRRQRTTHAVSMGRTP